MEIISSDIKFNFKNAGGFMGKADDWAELRFNDPARIPIGKCQQNLFDIVRQVKETKSRRLITKEGIVVAVLSPLHEVATLDEFLEKNIGE